MNNKVVTVLDWLEKQEKSVPDKIAVQDAESKLTYKELAVKARKIGSSITCKNRSAVVIFMEKSADCFAAMLGTLYAACYYVVIDTEIPAQRVKFICELLDASICFTDTKFNSKAQEIFTPLGIAVICVNNIAFCMQQDDFLLLRRESICDIDPMYCNFTSGSTGNPKGVLIAHRSVVDFIPIFCHTMNLNSEDIFGNQAPFDFDVSVKDIYSALYLGAEVNLIPRRYFINTVALMDYIYERQISVLVWSVGAMLFVSGMKGFSYRVPKKIKHVIFSGEVIPHKHLKIWKQYLPDTQFVNVYGPTEVTCNCTYHHLKEEDFESEDIPIGKNFLNERVFLLDKNNQEIIAPNVTGEICVIGTCLALGYIGENAGQSFCQNPLNKIYPEIVYRTGDRGFFDKNGLLHYVGRIDFQIKHLGHRIELSEIERNCNKLPNITRSCCLYQVNNKRLILYYEGDVSEKEVAKSLKLILPQYMVPSIICRLEHIPINNHGKIDRVQLINCKKDRC